MGASRSFSKIGRTVGMVVLGGRTARRVVEKNLQLAFEGDEFGDLRADLVETGVQDVSRVARMANLAAAPSPRRSGLVLVPGVGELDSPALRSSCEFP